MNDSTRSARPTYRGLRAGPLTSLSDALHIVSEFCRNDQEEMTVSNLSRRVGVPKSKVSRILATFREAGWLEQNPRTKVYRVGLKAYAFGARFLHGSALANEAAPILRVVTDRSGFAASISVLDGEDPLYLLRMEGPIAADFCSHVGSYFPVHATAPGRVILAFSETATVESILKEPRMRSIPTPKGWNVREIHGEIAAIRQVGYAVSHGDKRPGLGGIAVPVFGTGQTLIAALSISYPLSTVPVSREPYYVRLLFDAASTLSRRLGASLYPYAAEAAHVAEPPKLRRVIQAV